MTIARRMIRDRRRSVEWWALGVLLMVGLMVVMYPSVRDQAGLEDVLAQMPEALRGMIGYDEAIGMTSPAGYLQGRLFSLVMPLMLVVFGIGIGARAIGGLEDSGRMEPLLANPVTRTRVALERLLGAVVLLAVLTVAFAVVTLAMAPLFGALEGVRIVGLLGACAAAGALALLHLSVAYTVGAATGRRGPAVGVASAVAAGGYVIHSLLSVADVIAPLRFLTPWYWYLQRNMLASGVPPAAIIAPLVVSTLVGGLGWLLFCRRDLR